MSLYDLYFSDENKKHMYKLLYNITNNILDRNIFNSIYINIFENTNTDNLLDINKELFEEILEYYNITDISNLETNSNDISITSNTNDISINDNNDIISITSNTNDIIENKESYNNHGYISSVDKLEGSRFKYKLKMNDNIKYIEKIIIPIENNDIFVNNTIKLIIPELGIDTICYCKNTNNIRNHTYGTYILEDNLTKLHSDIINISIESLLGNSEYEEKIVIDKKEDEYYVTKLENIFVGDILKSTNNNKYKVVNIDDNKITFNKELDDNDNEFININLQNIIVYKY
jgi:hypothetical protein